MHEVQIRGDLSRFDVENSILQALDRPATRTVAVKILSFGADPRIGEGGPILINDMNVSVWQIVQDEAFYFTSVALKAKLNNSAHRIVQVACLPLGHDMPGRKAYLIIGMM